MIRLKIHAQGRVGEDALELGSGESVVLGRRPEALDAEAPTRTHGVPAPSVSSVHARVTHEGETVAIEDLASRNGTWLRLPSHAPVRVPACDTISLHLAGEPEAEPLDELPTSVTYTGARDYGARLAGVITAWFSAHDIAVQVRVSRRSDASETDRTGSLALPTGEMLIVEPHGTVPAGFLDALQKAERFVARQNHLFVAADEMRSEGLVVASPAMRRAVARVVEAAAAGARSLLLVGPSGSGKEGLARCFHRHSGRPGPFVARNCGLMQRELARSELFGAEKGAFSGCVQRITGAVEQANAGTLFLDELGELPRDVQPMLLRFLDHGEFERMGRYGRPLVSDVRVVGATSSDLRSAALREEFRLDLWFRLSVFVVEVPPLSERLEDVEAFLRSRTVHGGISLFDALAPDARALLRTHRWDGNFRELRNFAERASLEAARGTVGPDACRAILEEGALRPIDSPSGTRARPNREASTARPLDAFAERASAAFRDDHGGAGPESWDDVKNFVENYFKPLLFAELAGASDAPSFDDVDLRETARRLGADRGTAAKQLARYFDRLRDGA